MRKTKLLTLAVATVIAGTSLISVSSAADIMTWKDGIIDVITICEEGNTSKCITLMDRNLWASTNDITNTGSYGNYYQRWNNHPFAYWELSAIAQNATTDRASWDISYSNYWYNWSITSFMKWSTDYWENNAHYDDLWWWSGDGVNNNRWYNTGIMQAINETWRQWPCPENYHVPSRWEWNTFMNLYSDGTDQNTVNDAEFLETFNIPSAGFLYNNDANNKGCGAFIWLSSPNAGSITAMYFNMDLYSSNCPSKVGRRADGMPLRCFKNSSVTSSSDDGWESLITVNIAALNSGQNTCSWEDYIFPNISALPTVQTISLAKRFSCVFWNAAAKAVTLQLSGDLKDWNGNVISWENVKLSNPEWTATPAVLKNWTTTFSGQTFLWTWKTLFNKVANKIWQAYWSGVEIKITIPAWTPDGLYEGTLVLTY